MTWRSGRGWRQWMLAAAMMWCVVASPCGAAIYIKFDGIDGEVVEGRFPKWSEVVGLGNEARRSVEATDPPSPPTLACVVRKRLDKSSPLLVKRCGEGQPVARVVLAAAERGQVYYRMVLEDVLITSVRQGVPAGTGGPPIEEVSLHFKRVSWSTAEVGPDGEVVGGDRVAFDLTTGASETTPRPPFRAIVGQATESGAIRLLCPVEKGRRYRLSMSLDLKGGWTSVLEFTGAEDGVAEQIVRNLPALAFLRIEELE